MIHRNWIYFHGLFIASALSNALCAMFPPFFFFSSIRKSAQSSVAIVKWHFVHMVSEIEKEMKKKRQHIKMLRYPIYVDDCIRVGCYCCAALATSTSN